MIDNPLILEKLTRITDDEWKVIADKCKKHIKLKLSYSKRKKGAHSEQTLGVSAFDFYFCGAVEKIYEGVWIWKHELYSMEEQLIRIINSMISEQVRKFKTDKNKEQKKEYVNIDPDLFDLQDDYSEEEINEKEKELDHLMALTQEAVQGDNDLEMLVLYLLDGKSNDEMASDFNITKKDLYKLSEKMRDKVRKLASVAENQIQKQ